jgi:hypothetical protein
LPSMTSCGNKRNRIPSKTLIWTGCPIFRQVKDNSFWSECDTPIRLRVGNSNPAILAPQLLWLSTAVTIRLTSPRRLIPACETKNTSKNSKETQHSNW